MSRPGDKTIGQLDAATTLKGDESFLIYQAGHTRNISIKELTEYFKGQVDDLWNRKIVEATNKIKETGL